MRYLLDKDGNLFKAIVVSSVPQGFTDITAMSKEEDGIQGLSSDLLEVQFVDEIPAVPAIPHVPKHWTDGTSIVYDADDIPTLTDENGDAYLDPAWHVVAAVAAVDEVPAVPAHYIIKKNSEADQKIRQAIMDKVSAKRQPLLAEADIMINKLEDQGQDTSAWRAYRQALRDVTEPFKSLVNGSWKVAVESIVIDEFQFPAKP